MTDATVAFLGLGHMGRAMAKRLSHAGFHLRLWDRTPGRAVAGKGVEVFATPQEAVKGAPFVMTSLTNDEAVRDVTFAFLGTMEPDSVHLGTSTISWSLAKALVDVHAQRSTHYVAACVLGRPDAAERGDVAFIVGGDVEVARRCQPIFDAIGNSTIVADSAPQAHLTKIIANFMIANTIEMLGEATALAEKGGILPENLVDMLGRTIVGSPVLRGYGARIARGEFEPAGFRLEMGLKDVSLALSAGEELRAPLPMASLVHDHMVEAIAKGRAQQDWTALAAVAREAAGLSERK